MEIVGSRQATWLPALMVSETLVLAHGSRVLGTIWKGIAW